jgi:glycine hydroxymethyltransferase
MGLSLASGGHLTHGHQTEQKKISSSAIYFNAKPYTTNPETGLLDYDLVAQQVAEFKPKLIIVGGSAYTRDWDYAKFRQIANDNGAYLMCDMAHTSGLIASQCLNDPFPHCDVVTSTTHKSLRGPRSGVIFMRKQFADAINFAVFPSNQGGPHNT